MKYQRPHRLPADWLAIKAADELKRQSKFTFSKRPKSSPGIYRPNAATKAAQKKKITLAKITMRGSD